MCLGVEQVAAMQIVQTATPVTAGTTHVREQEGPNQSYMLRPRIVLEVGCRPTARTQLRLKFGNQRQQWQQR